MQLGAFWTCCNSVTSRALKTANSIYVYLIQSSIVIVYVVCYIIVPPLEKLRQTGGRNMTLPSWSRAASEPVKCGPTSGTGWFYVWLISIYKENNNLKKKTYRENKSLYINLLALITFFYDYKGSPYTSPVQLIIPDLCKWPAGINVAFARPPSPHARTRTHAQRGKWISLSTRSLLCCDPSAILQGQQTNFLTVG